MNDLLTFANERFGKIRALTLDGEPWLVGKDVALALGYKKPENAIAAHVDEEDKTTTLIQGTGSNYKSNAVLINESGFYSLAFGSKMKEAKAFKRWVTREVLPSIRKTGGYLTDAAKASMTEELRAAVREAVRAELAKRPAPPAVAPNNLAVLIDSTRRIMKDMYCSPYEIAAMARDNYVAFGVPVPETLRKALQVEQDADDFFSEFCNPRKLAEANNNAAITRALETILNGNK